MQFQAIVRILLLFCVLGSRANMSVLLLCNLPILDGYEIGKCLPCFHMFSTQLCAGIMFALSPSV